ncbi:MULTISPECIES: two-component system histidine kinase PnpS [Salimicrobium]|uniref:histidine kinase n=2 Tax=Salimicrobium TaxID=351195 RepID=K2GNZ6_9BACI|nr:MULTISPECIES: ATP-binding protein [Salimicrobium]AKG04151.1 PAS domain-containing sensor histidine kinase [Salimicrobium jeotgali]EKE32109.1 two-component sensor histidine kinase [Salimicrobium jeotgali]MBM7695719.1 two-component system phosphate regulon sensor histidine kinase PhoR [Salimicrobium jeotgali]SDX59779.1 two-component system, OmpR family, phosphate regulon sensor histidine kinase PhoR [Salimicrobium album]
MNNNGRILLVYALIILILMLSFGLVLAQYAQQSIIEVVGENGMERAEEASRNIWFMTFIMISVIAMALITICYQIFIKYVDPMRKATDTAEELSHGNYRARADSGVFGDAGRLGAVINELGRHLKELTSVQGMQETRLSAVINHMSSGLVLIDEKGYIQLVNESFIRTFKEDKAYYLDYLYHEVVPHEEVQSVVENVYMFEEPDSQMLTIQRGLERKFIQVNGAPIFKENKRWQGVVLVFHDITELKKLEQMRKDFVANVSHELKTPITSIRGFAETLLEGAAEDKEKNEQFLGIMLKESTRLETLIHDLLELTKIEREDFQLSLQQVNITDLVMETKKLVQTQADRKGIRISEHLDTDAVCEGDSTRIRQVLINILSNAITYTPDRGEINVRLHDEKDRITVSVSDSGIGIPPEEIPRLFERFYRVDRARSRNSGGTGLGLAIVKHIMEAHRGEVYVQSVPGEGSEFTLVFHKVTGEKIFPAEE